MRVSIADNGPENSCICIIRFAHEEPECDAGVRERVMDTCNINVWIQIWMRAAPPWLIYESANNITRTLYLGELSSPALSLLAMKLEIRIGRGWGEGTGTRLMNTSIQENRRG